MFFSLPYVIFNLFSYFSECKFRHFLSSLQISLSKIGKLIRFSSKRNRKTMLSASCLGRCAFCHFFLRRRKGRSIRIILKANNPYSATEKTLLTRENMELEPPKIGALVFMASIWADILNFCISMRACTSVRRMRISSSVIPPHCGPVGWG